MRKCLKLEGNIIISCCQKSVNIYLINKMMGGFIAFRCSNYDSTAEREQFRLLCKKMKSKYFKSENFYLFVANYNIYDSELDALVIKNDAIVAIEFKNYGGNIVAAENGDWTANGIAIKGGSRKTVYQQARINHASLKNGLRDLGINNDWIRNIPTLIVFNQPIILDNQLSGKVQSWLHPNPIAFGVVVGQYCL